jgi:hypothetical protein
MGAPAMLVLNPSESGEEASESVGGEAYEASSLTILMVTLPCQARGPSQVDSLPKDVRRVQTGTVVRRRKSQGDKLQHVHSTSSSAEGNSKPSPSRPEREAAVAKESEKRWVVAGCSTKLGDRLLLTPSLSLPPQSATRAPRPRLHPPQRRRGIHSPTTDELTSCSDQSWSCQRKARRSSRV